MPVKEGNGAVLDVSALGCVWGCVRGCVWGCVWGCVCGYVGGDVCLPFYTVSKRVSHITSRLS